ncbi:hypothetical protein BT93_H3787 [Corymbia citriodora subsp. variegata]|nr:hypothetical protein BT93_H3787 [Corymbia citriodora subsp. variegata]
MPPLPCPPRPPHPPHPPPLPPPPRRLEEYGVGGIGKAMAAGVIHRRLGKDQDLLDGRKVDDKLLAKGLDAEEGREESSKSLVHCAGRHPWSLKRLGSFLNGKSTSPNVNGIRYWRSW